MRVTHKDVEVRITRRTLWVDDQAYPIHMITSVRPREHRPNRGRMVAVYLRRARGSIGLGVVGLIAIGCLGNSIPTFAATVFVLLMLGVLGFHTVQLIQWLRMPTVYALSMTTAGTTRAVVVSTDAQKIKDLARNVIDAIDNPALDYTVHIDHLEFVHGDKVDGDKIMGDLVERDKVIF